MPLILEMIHLVHFTKDAICEIFDLFIFSHFFHIFLHCVVSIMHRMYVRVFTNILSDVGVIDGIVQQRQHRTKCDNEYNTYRK